MKTLDLVMACARMAIELGTLGLFISALCFWLPAIAAAPN